MDTFWMVDESRLHLQHFVCSMQQCKCTTVIEKKEALLEVFLSFAFMRKNQVFAQKSMKLLQAKSRRFLEVL